jgi:ribosomal protein S18 acetylase RimI-like enzyme
MTALTPVTHRVRKATSADVARIAAVQAQAFHDDPVFIWWIPDDDRRRATLPAFFELYLESFLVHDEVYVNADVTGTVVWGPPANPLGIDDEEAFGRRLEQIVAEVDMGRVYELATLFEEHHPREPHYYLQWAAVEPERQGQGIGSALLTPVLRRCDRDGMSAYTEATSLHNRRLYERHGFTFLNEIAPASGPPLYRMWRKPAAK